MNLIFLRHAAAEIRAPGLADEMRRLTVKGRKKTESVAKGLAHFLKGTSGINVWASHALRSRETAVIVAATFSGVKTAEYPAIYNGNLEELMSQWGQLKRNQTIIIVGHEPHLSIWARQLADVTLPFKKCAAAGFELSTPSSAKLTWFATPKMLVQLGKNS
jgi:phosphohistidine phosphatase